MPSGAAVIRYKGKRGVVWRVKYADTDGRQVQETLGPEPDWNRKKAKAELRERLVRVEREGFRQPASTTFASFADQWLPEYADKKGLKRSTRQGYKLLLDRHLVPVFGALKLDAVDVEAIDGYLAAKRRDGLAPRTLNRHLNLLNTLLGDAVKWAAEGESGGGGRPAKGAATSMADPLALRGRAGRAGVR